ncbi:protein ALP1-like [Hibiscus syriacus]|uniref:protein ALP1-like n=1 Tax=Hibiscus syriacus TaxID=106335 RepID=UPI001924D432|nr:protein ALP1-like [Hibiscus syriacus]
MEHNSIHKTIVGVAASALVFGALWIHRIKSRKQISRQCQVNRDDERENYINSILYTGDQNCIDIIRMQPLSFFNLCDILTRNNFLQSTRSMNVKEQVIIFLHIIGHNVRFRVIGSRYYRSIETIHRYFRIVLRAIMKLYKLAIRLPDESTPPEIINNSRFYPYFKDCVGALDGTHIRASVPPNIQGRFRSRKGGTTQNVLAAIKFDLKFLYVLAGWEGSAHDSRILTDALTRPRGFSIPEGKYYLADAGYGIRNGIISPYRGVRYHLKEFSNHRPENAKELFNLRHSSLRTTVERVFGILKKRFRVLDAEPFWDFQTQIDIVLACTIIHNHIMGVDPNDIINEGMYEEPEPYSITSMLTQREEREEAREWASKRDEIAEAMWIDYININM